jgi:hypothetical protein
LPETLGAGCAFLDYDGEGWLDIFTDVTERAGLAAPMCGMGVAVADYDGFPDNFVTAVGRSRRIQASARY